MDRKHTIVRVPQRDYVIDLTARRVRYVCHLLQVNPFEVTIRIQVDDAHEGLGEVETTTLGEGDLLVYDGAPSEEVAWDHHQRTEAGEQMPTMLRLLPRPSTYPEGISIQRFRGYNRENTQQWEVLEHPTEYSRGHCEAAMADPHAGHGSDFPPIQGRDDYWHG